MKKILAIFILVAFCGQSHASFSPKSESEVYNEGVDLMFKLKFKKAEKKFRQALELDADFGEAHNNLAYCLRKQGADHYDEALQHYNQAVDLMPEAGQPYMYRGVLYMSMDRKSDALADHTRLLELGEEALAGELQWVIEQGKEKDPEQFFGVFDTVESE